MYLSCLLSSQQFDENGTENTVDVNMPGAGERKAIHRAAGANHTHVIAFLLGKGAEVDILDKTQRTALHWAAIGGHVEAGQVLIEAGANPFAATATKMTALHAACEEGRADFVDFILEAAGEGKLRLFNALDGNGKRPIDLATTVCKMKKMKILLFCHSLSCSGKTWRCNFTTSCQRRSQCRFCCLFDFIGSQSNTSTSKAPFFGFRASFDGCVTTLRSSNDQFRNCVRPRGNAHCQI
jgi:hypothetical protein